MERLDSYLFKNGFTKSRQQAKNMILSGFVTVNGQAEKKPSYTVKESDEIILSDKPKYVGRGGYKLEKALDVFKISPANKICLDIGASTGGFTDCLLKNGAAKVFAVDVGHGQLDESLLNNPAVVNLENTHVKDLTEDMISKPDIITVDVSFISLKKVIPHLKKFISSNTFLICLFKPQFEVGKTNKGIVRNKKEHILILKDFINYISSENLFLFGLDFSPIKGGDGNIEFLLYIRADECDYRPDIQMIVETAHASGR